MAKRQTSVTNKVARHRKTLKCKLALQLKNDMLGLLHNGNHTDLTLRTNKISPILLHKCILETRAPAGVMQLICGGKAMDDDVSLTINDPKILQQVLIFTYCEEDVSFVQDICASMLTTAKNVSAGNPQSTSVVVTEANLQDGHSIASLSIDDINAEDRILVDAGPCIEPIHTASTEPVCSDYTISSFNSSDTTERTIPDCITSELNEQILSNCTHSDPTVLNHNSSNTTFPNHSPSDCPSSDPVERTLVDSTSLDPSEETLLDSSNLPVEEYEACSCLGHDLLALYHSGKWADITIEADGTEFQAHRCILSARSAYFTAMLEGGWMESDKTAISLQGISAAAMRQVLLFIYGGVLIDLSPGVNECMLLYAADMYALDSMKDVISLALRDLKCHFFHKPCTTCLNGVCDCLPLAVTYRLNKLAADCLQWTADHFVRLWPSRPFAHLPADIHELCLKHVVSRITSITVLDMVTQCDTLNGRLTTVHWVQPIIGMASQLMEACIEFLSRNMASVLTTQKFYSFAQTNAFGLSRMEEIFARAIVRTPLDKACHMCREVFALDAYSKRNECSEEFHHMVAALCMSCEEYMAIHMSQLVDRFEWSTMLTPELQARLKQVGGYVCVGDRKKMRAAPKLTSSMVTKGGAKRAPKSGRIRKQKDPPPQLVNHPRQPVVTASTPDNNHQQYPEPQLDLIYVQPPLVPFVEVVYKQ